MKTLVTGGKGFIGSYVVEELAKGGNEVIIYDHVQDSIGLKGLRDLSSERLRTIEADILDDDALLKIISTERPDCVVHLAAITGIKRCLDAKRQSFEVNVYGTYNIASASANVNSKLVFVSSREVYGESAGKSTPENTPLLPNNVYGLTKMLAEKLVRHFGQ